MENLVRVAEFFAIGFLISALALTSCAATRGPGDAKTLMGCQRCYDLALTFQRDMDKRQPWTQSKSRALHMCKGCKAHIELYTLDGKPMIRCPHCAPAGQACDRCRPPEPPTEDEQDTSGRC